MKVQDKFKTVQTRLSQVPEKEQEELKQSDFPFKTLINNKEVHFRKWKVKDKYHLDNAHTKYEKQQALIYGCLEDNTLQFDSQEAEYMLYQIRKQSLKTPIIYKFTCAGCGQEFEYTANLDEIFTVKNSKYEPFTVGQYTIEFQEIKNAKFYFDTLENIQDENTKVIVDMALHIKSINDNVSLNITQIMEFINNLDTDIFEEIITKFFEQRFSINKVHEVSCPNCGTVEKYFFDYVPNLYPVGWNV